MPNVRQIGIDRRCAARSYAVVNINPLYTRASSSTSSRIPGARGGHRSREFCDDVQQVQRQDAVKHVIVGSLGDLLGSRGVLVSLVVRRMKNMVPAYSVPAPSPSTTRWRAGRG